MKFSTFVTSKEDILACAAAPSLDEVLIEPATLSREGRLSLETGVALAREACEHELSPVLVWDILMTQDEFKTKQALVESLDLSPFTAIRTQCPGAALWVKERYPEKHLHFIVENSNHNLPGLQRWVNHLKPKRLVLSTQLPEEKLLACCAELQTECEILGAGKILLFYSKRHLLTPHFSDDEGATPEWMYADSASEESASRPFPTIENEHGTFMYLNKDHFILDSLEKLAAGGMHTVRIDLRDLQDGTHAARGIVELCQMTLENDKALENAWARPTSAPFFKRNKTDKQFARLKSQTRVFRDSNCVAEVVSAERGELLGLFTLRPFDTTHTSFVFIAPDGREVPVTLEAFTGLSGEALNRCEPYRIVRCGWVKGITAGSLLVKSVRNLLVS